MTLDTCFEGASIEYARVQVATNGAGPRHVRQINTSHTPNTNEPEVRRWSVTAQLANQAQFEHLESVWAETKGGVVATTWTPPDESSEISVLVTSYQIIYAGHGRFEVALELEEDF